MGKVLPYIFAIAFAAGILSCRDFSSYVKGDLIASAGGKDLYIEDVESIFTPGMSPGDSIARLKAYVDLWAKNQLKIRMAEKQFSKDSDGKEIEKMVEDYRNSLLIHKFEEDLVARDMDTSISNSEITEYYNANRKEFTLAWPIVKGYMIKVPTGFRQESRIRELVRLGLGSSADELVDIAVKNGFDYREYPDWTDFSAAMKFMPQLSSRDYERLQTTGGFVEATDNGFRYFLNFTYVLKAGEYTPPSMATSAIRVMILNRRKEDMIRKFEDSIYSAALANRTITIKQPDINEED